VAHEAIFRRRDKLREWIAAQREFLVWRTELEGYRRTWLLTRATSKNTALLVGFSLVQAESWLEKRSQDISESARDLILQCKLAKRRQAAARARWSIAFIEVHGRIIRESIISGQVAPLAPHWGNR
jgi:hypothetical protein